MNIKTNKSNQLQKKERDCCPAVQEPTKVSSQRNKIRIWTMTWTQPFFMSDITTASTFDMCSDHCCFGLFVPKDILFNKWEKQDPDKHARISLT